MNKLREVREARHLSREKLEAVSGVPARAIKAYESGQVALEGIVFQYNEISEGSRSRAERTVLRGGIGMNDQMIPYIAFEAEQARNERHIRRLWIALIITIILIALTNAIWLYEWTRYDYSDIEVDGGDNGVANYIGRDGDITNGEDTSEIEDSEGWKVQKDEDET